MQRFIVTDSFDLDLVFTRDFDKEERPTLPYGRGAVQNLI